MEICFISDTHTQHRNLILRPADMIIHAGDISDRGFDGEVVEFLNWYSSLPFKYKIFIAGNHDRLFEVANSYARSLIPSNVIYLQNEGIEIEGLKIWGTPYCLPVYNWSFGLPEFILDKIWESVPKDLDIFISHTPPYSILDRFDNKFLGSETLLKHLNYNLKPKIHVFGHIHEGYGSINKGNTFHMNVSQAGEKYVLKNQPVYVTV